MEHNCSECGEMWFDNKYRPPCPKCGNTMGNGHFFDEAPECFYDDDYEE